MGLPISLPPPQHLSVPDPARRWMFFVIPWPSSPTASDTPGTHLGEEGPVSPWLLALSAPQGRDLMLFASPKVFCSRLKLPGTGNNNPGRRWQQGSVTRG